MTKRLLSMLLALLLAATGFCLAETTEAVDPASLLPEGVVPVTWDVSADHLMIEGDEARALYERIVSGDYPTMEELRANHVVAQLDALSAYYKALYGNTAEIDTLERDALRDEILSWFLTLGSARTDHLDSNGYPVYAYDGPLSSDYWMLLVLGLPASGKSTHIVDPVSELTGAFILDPDVIKGELPEYKQTHGAAADAIHFEGMDIFQKAVKAFTEGEMKGVNAIIPIVSSDLQDLMDSYIHPFEEAGYNVKVAFREAEPNAAAARVVMRELRGGQLINSAVAFSSGYGPEEVYNTLATMTNAKGENYVYDWEEALEPAA